MDSFSRIKLVGVELEGGWHTAPPHPMISDGSITLSRNTAMVDGHSIQHVGEIPSPPFGSPSEMFEWMKLNYPHYTNSSCGMHVHVSFKSQNSYLRIMDQKFFDYMIEKLLEWGKANGIKDKNFFNRLEGRNTYCKREYNPMGQVKYTNKGPHRYSILNYCHARYGTAELRVLPLFKTLEEATKAITAYFNIIESWLAQPPVGLKSVKVSLDLKAEESVPASTREMKVVVDDAFGDSEQTISVPDSLGETEIYI